MKQTAVLVVYFLLVSWSVVSSLLYWGEETLAAKVLSRPKKIVEVQRFYEVEGFYLDPGGSKVYYLANQLKIYDRTLFLFENPRGEVYSERIGTTDYKAEKGRLDQKKALLTFENNAEFLNQDFDLLTDKALYHLEDEIVEGFGNVDSRVSDPKSKDVIKAKSEYIKMYQERRHVHYAENVVGKIIRPRPYDEVTYFWGQTMDVDFFDRMAELQRDVRVKSQNFDIKARKGELFLDNFHNELKYYVFYDDVEVDQKYQEQDGTWAMRKAYGEKLEGYPSEEKIVMSGTPKVIQGQDVIRGNLITLRQNIGLVEVEDSTASFIYED